MSDDDKDRMQSAQSALEEAQRFLWMAAMDGRMSLDRQVQFCNRLRHASKKVMELGE